MSTNCEKTLIYTLQNIILFTKHVIYLWHINKNVFINYKLLFDIKKSWQKFYNNWYGVLYSVTKSIFEKKWAEFQAKYETDY